MDVGAWTLRWQRWLVLALLVASAWIVWTGGDDNFALPKAELLVLGSVVLLVLTVIRWSWTRRVVVPRSAPLAAAAVFAVSLVISTLTSTSRLESVVGQYQQYSGLASYLACVVVFGVMVRSFRSEHLVWVLRAFVVAMVGVAAVGLLQMLGFNPGGFTSGSQIVATLGNVDFVAGWLAVAIGPCIVLAARTEELPAWRIAAGLGAVGGFIVILGSGSFQGPVAGGAAMVVAAAAAIVVRRPFDRWWTRRNVVLAVVGVSVVVVAGAAVGWSFIHRSIDEGMYDRRAFWSAAVHVVEDHPLVGTGPDTFHNQFLSRRPLNHAGNNAGSAHDVPLDMFANGGLVTGLPYLAFLGLTLAALVRIWRRSRGSDRLLVGGIAAAWAGYVVQSLVSIDRPGLIITHWVVAGAIAASAVSREPFVLTLPGALEGRRQATRGPGWLVPSGLAVVLAVVAAVPLTRPLRATAAAYRASQAVQRGDIETAIADVEESRSLAPWEAHHTFLAIRIYALAGRPKEVIAEAEAGARLEAGDSSYAVVAAQAAKAVGDLALSARWWGEAMRRDPNGADVLYRAAAAIRDDHITAAQIAAPILRVDPLAGWRAQGLLEEVNRNYDEARKLLERALALDPDDPASKQGLSEIPR